MTAFYFKAADGSGNVVEGEMEATDRHDLIRQVYQRGLTPIRAEVSDEGRIARARTPGRHKRLSGRELATLTEELATLLEADLELDQALAFAANSITESDAKSVAARLREEVRSGRSLSEALEKVRPAVPETYRNLILAGESAGALPTVMRRLAAHHQQLLATRDRVLSSLIYPSVVMLVAAVSIGVILLVVAPRFRQVFADMGATLPWLTRAVMGLGESLVQGWWLWLSGLLAIVWVISYALRQPAYRRWGCRMLLSMPVVDTFTIEWETSRFTRTLAILIQNGIPLAQALDIACQGVANPILAEDLTDARQRFRRGERFADALAAMGRFPERAVALARVGEESGRLADMLFRIADLYDGRLTVRLQRFLAIFEPAMIIGLALIVGTIVMSMLLAVLGLNDLPL